MNSHTNTLQIPIPVQATTEVPVEITRLLAIFEQELAGVSFPDVSQEALRAATSDIQARAKQVADARSQLDEAVQQLVQSHEALRRLGERALAYAKVYASGDEELGARLEAVSLGEASRRKRRKAAEPASEGPKRRKRGIAEESSATMSGARPAPQLIAVGG
ncbi:MAG: hypothetical protein MUF54_24605 [Polyangiaceae bacterium]|nr:hypothetical protein [Polyangiaceae bacterium]